MNRPCPGCGWDLPTPRAKRARQAGVTDFWRGWFYGITPAVLFALALKVVA